jgi:hypothetical protein
VRKAIDERMKRLFHIEEDGSTCKPYVCAVCDRFCSKDWCVTSTQSLESISEFLTAEGANLTDCLRECYRYEGPGSQDWMKTVLLSKRAIYCKNGSKTGFVVCNECRNHVRKDRFPRRSIANGFYFGTAPKELSDLWQSELAVLTPSSCFGYCFTYIGGTNMKLKGTLGYYKVKPEAIARVVAVSNALLKVLNREVVFILHGRMTKKQRKKALERSKIRPTKLIAAIEWLEKNNGEWQDVNMEDIEENVKKCQPILVDKSEEVEEGEDCSTEDQESFSVYFPDGSMTEVYGGKNSACDFKKVVTEAHNRGFNGEVVSNLSRDFAKDYLGNTFVSSCILQMPFGLGGSDLRRHGMNRDNFGKWDLDEYAEHLSMISTPAFQTPLFILKLFNIKLRSNILRSATQQLYSKMSVWNLRDTINSEDFQLAARAHAAGRSAGSVASRQLVKCIDSVNKNLPHSNGAVKRARMFMESLQQQFGLGGIFLTVTPDDENTFLITAYSQVDQNGKPIDVTELSSEVLKAKANKRNEVRLQFPGITALNFEYVLDTVCEIVIGWDIKKNCPTGTPGLFGVPKAFGGAVEEQGRTSLHVHFIIWLHGWDS